MVAASPARAALRLGLLLFAPLLVFIMLQPGGNTHHAPQEDAVSPARISPEDHSSPPQLPSPPQAAEGASDADDAFRVVTAQSSKSSSAAHCSINVLTKDAWKTNACWYTNLCYDLAQHDFVFFNEIKGAREPLVVTLDHKSGFRPRTVDGPLPLPRLEPLRVDEIFVPFQSTHSLLEDVVRDETFALWLLAANSPWESYSGIQPIVLGETAGGLTSRALSWMEVLLEAVPISLNHLHARERVNFVCFPRAAMGLGAFTDHCDVDSHAVTKLINKPRSFREPRFPCAFGRGPLFWRMRLDMLNNLGLSDAPQELHHVVINSEENDDLLGPLKERLEREQHARVEVVNLGALSLKEQAAIVLRANVLVTRSTGAGSAATHFMPRNTAVVVICANQGCSNYGYFGGLGYVRPYFQVVGEFKVEDLARLVEFENQASDRMRQTV